jgi:hypothetical protein
VTAVGLSGRLELVIGVVIGVPAGLGPVPRRVRVVGKLVRRWRRRLVVAPEGLEDGAAAVVFAVVFVAGLRPVIRMPQGYGGGRGRSKQRRSRLRWWGR